MKIANNISEINAFHPERKKSICDNVDNNIEQYSTADKLIYANKEAVIQTGKNLKEAVTHPIKTVFSSVKQVGNIFIHPVNTAKNIAENFKKDKVDGIMQGCNIATTVASVSSIALGVGACVAAPFTAGASLALLPVAATIGGVSGTAGLALMGGSLMKNQVDCAKAKTLDRLNSEVGQIASDYTGAVTVAVSYGAMKGISYAKSQIAIGKKINPASVERVSRRYGVKDGNGHCDPPALKETLAKSNREIAKIDELKSVPDADTVTLYHGTTAEVADSITQNGFKSSDIGDYGSGVYLTDNPKAALNYADDRFYTSNAQPSIVVSKVKVGKVLDYKLVKDDFLSWAKSKFNPADLSDDINVIYKNSKTPMSPWMDTTWNRYLPRYMDEFGYSSIVIKAEEGVGYNYWVIPDSSKINITQNVTLATPKVSFNPIAPATVIAAGQKVEK